MAQIDSDANARAGMARSAAHALGGLIETGLARSYSGTQGAAAAWFRANGDLEHRHTAGVFLKESADGRTPPILIVYIDSSSMLADFTTNKDLYAIRLAHAGFEVSDVQFKLSRNARTAIPTEAPDTKRKVLEPLPELTDGELRAIEEQTADLPEAVRDSVKDAMISSLRREKSLSTEEGTTSPQKRS